VRTDSKPFKRGERERTSDISLDAEHQLPKDSPGGSLIEERTKKARTSKTAHILGYAGEQKNKKEKGSLRRRQEG